MKHPKIKWGLLGGGPDSLIGVVHRVAAYMRDDYELVGGVFNADHELGKQAAAHWELDPARAYATVDELIDGENALPADQRMSVITVATPNYLHFEMAMKLVQSGFNVICEKPVTTTSAEAAQLAALLRTRRRVFAVTHTYTGYPMVRQMRAMIAQGAIGPVQKVDAQYYQGWINPVIHDKSKWASVWRLNPRLGGQSCCIGDIGVHAFNLIEYTTGLTVEKLLADVDTLYPDNLMDVDGTVLLRMTAGVRGIVCASQIATAEENNLQIAVYGRAGALKWAQEEPNRLEFLLEGKAMTVIKPGYDFNLPAARDGTKLPPGHPEGFIDAMGNIYRGVAKAVNGESVEVGEFPTIQDGVRGMRFVEAALESARSGNLWVSL